jgi:hypothetical protein
LVIEDVGQYVVGRDRYIVFVLYEYQYNATVTNGTTADVECGGRKKGIEKIVDFK